jgi:hypothetical protein
MTEIIRVPSHAIAIPIQTTMQAIASMVLDTVSKSYFRKKCLNLQSVS